MRAIAGAAVVLLIVGLFILRPEPVENLDLKACDLLVRQAGPGQPSGQVALVAIDERSLAEYGHWPWPRDLTGLLVQRILEQGADTVVLDMMFPATAAPSASTAGDEALAKALSGKRTVAGFTLTFNGNPGAGFPCGVRRLPFAVAAPRGSRSAGLVRASGALCNAAPISEAAAATGFLNVALDLDGRVRRLPLLALCGDGYCPSLALAARNVFRRSSDTAQLKENGAASRLRQGSQVYPIEAGALRLRYRGPAGAFPYLSAAEVLAGRAPAETLRGKIAIVGGSAMGIENSFATPLDALYPGVEVQATAIDNLLTGDVFRRSAYDPLGELTLALLLGFASVFLLTSVRSLWGAAITLGLAAAAWAGCSFALAYDGTLHSPLPALTVLAANLSLLTLLNYVGEKKRADRTERFTRTVLEESETRYQRLVENINDAIIVADNEGRLVFANRRFREWYGLTGKDIRDVTLEDCVAPEWRSSLRDRFDRRIRGEAVPDHFEFEGLRPDGARVWIETLVTVIEENGRIAGTQCALRDVTERKRIEAQYLQAQKMESVGRLAGSVAHDFNNLLTVINGYSDLLLRQMGRQNPYHSSLEQIHMAGERAAELTQKLLAISRKQLAQPRPLDLNLVVADAERMFTRLVGEDIELITRLSSGLAQVMADPGQLHQVLMNLVVNARDAMPRGGKLTIETKNVTVSEDFTDRPAGSPPGPYVYLGVTDTGSGMTDEVKRRLFEPFFTTKEANRGTGLGLATVQGIIRQSGGWIAASSELERGTTFHIYLPGIAAYAAAHPPAVAPAASLRGSETILVVEDQDAVRQFVVAVLKEYGYHVLQASRGPDAIALVKRSSETIHLLLTDVILPVMNGRMLADSLRDIRPNLKVVYISGYAEETIGHGVLEDGLTYLAKPFAPEALAAKVREALGAAAAAG